MSLQTLPIAFSPFLDPYFRHYLEWQQWSRTPWVVQSIHHLWMPGPDVLTRTITSAPSSGDRVTPTPRYRKGSKTNRRKNHPSHPERRVNPVEGNKARRDGIDLDLVAIPRGIQSSLQLVGVPEIAQLGYLVGLETIIVLFGLKNSIWKVWQGQFDVASIFGRVLAFPAVGVVETGRQNDNARLSRSLLQIIQQQLRQ